MTEPNDLAERYFLEFAAAYVRGSLPNVIKESPAETFQFGRQHGLRLHRFKRSTELPRVKRVLGFLEAVKPRTLLDIGTGRGVFLWPLLDRFEDLQVFCLDLLPHRVEMLQKVRAGGVTRLDAQLASAIQIPFPDDFVDIVCALEVLEHLEEPARAAREALRVARNFLVASVPSKEDSNPEHIQLFTPETFRALFLDAGASKVTLDWVPGHIIAMVTV